MEAIPEEKKELIVMGVEPLNKGMQSLFPKNSDGSYGSGSFRAVFK
jgi:hypothetical protein